MKTVVQKSFLLKILFLFITGLLFCIPFRVSAECNPDDKYNALDNKYSMSFNVRKYETDEYMVPVNNDNVLDDKHSMVCSTSNDGTAKYIAPVNTSKTVVVIPSRVSVDGIKYTLTSIAENAFKNNGNLRKVTIPKSVYKIGKQAFYNCQNLRKIVIKSTKNIVKMNAFGKIAKNATIWIPAHKINRYREYREMLKAKGFTGYLKILNGSDINPEEENTPLWKKKQTITVNKTITVKTYGKGETFNLGARAAGKITYQSSNRNVAEISASGVVKIKSCGTVVITVNAAATAEYEAATENVRLTVEPDVQFISVTSEQKGYLTFRWGRNSQVNGYEINYSTNKAFTSAKRGVVSDNRITEGAKSGLISGQIYYVRIRGYRLVNGIKTDGPWSDIKYCKVR